MSPLARQTIHLGANDDQWEPVLKALIDAGSLPDSVYVDEESSSELMGRTTEHPVSTTNTKSLLIYCYEKKRGNIEVDLDALARSPINNYPDRATLTRNRNATGTACQSLIPV